MWLPRFLSEERMRDVRRLVILDWLLGGTGERWTANADHLSEVDRAQARAILESQRTGLREALRRAIQECYGAAAPTPGTLAEDAAHDRVLVSLDPAFSPAAPVGADLAAAFGNLVDQAFTATYPGHPRFEPADVEVTVRDLAAVYAHVERAVADQDGRVRLEGDIAAVRRVANALHVGAAGETHFLFGDDRFGPWGAEFERAAARDGLQPQDTVTVGQLRGWIDAMRPELGLRDEVADLIVLAWAALRQRAWYHHGPPSRRRSRAPPGRTWSCGPSRCRPRPTGRRATSRAAGAVRDPGQPVPDRRRGRRVHREPPRARGQASPTRQRCWSRGWKRPTGTSGWPPTGPGRLATARAGRRAGRSLAPGGQPGAPGRVPGPGGAAATETAVANSLSRAAGRGRGIDGFRWERLAPLRAAEGQGRRARPGRRQHAAGAARGGGGGRVRDPAGAGPLPGRRRDLRLAGRWPACLPVEPPPGPRARTTCPSRYRRRPLHGRTGRATRREGRPGQEVLGPLAAFLDAHRDEQVVVEWRVQE